MLCQNFNTRPPQFCRLGLRRSDFTNSAVLLDDIRHSTHVHLICQARGSVLPSQDCEASRRFYFLAVAWLQVHRILAELGGKLEGYTFKVFKWYNWYSWVQEIPFEQLSFIPLWSQPLRRTAKSAANRQARAVISTAICGAAQLTVFSTIHDCERTSKLRLKLK